MASEKAEISAFEVAIVGTGLYGIQAARYYLDVYPKASVVLLEADDCIGGVWSSKRVYQDFWTQTPVRMAEFSDRPMAPPPAEDQYWGFFPAKYTTAYLESYVDNHIYNGQTIRDRVLFNTPVRRVEKTSEGAWILSHNRGCSIEAKRLVDATGMTSQPNIPTLPGAESFQGSSIHHKAFGSSDFLSDPRKQHIVVLGGAKSAADVAYASAKAGKSVSWIIREEGNGPAAFFAPQPVSKRYANSNEGFYNRLLASFLPNPFGSKSLLAKFLHGTWLGRVCLDQLWERFNKDLREITDYHREAGREMGFANLEPDTPVFWQNDSSGVNTRPNLLSMIATNVHVYRQSIDHVSANSVVLSPKNGSDDKPLTIPADVLVYCTGWSAISSLFTTEEASQLGLPVPMAEADPKLQAKWKALEDSADPKVLAKFPYIGHPPAYRRNEPTYTPVRLFKAIAPPANALHHSIVFLGKMVVGNNFRTAEAQALWTVAYLNGEIDAETSTMEEDVAMTVAWNRRRYLNKGQLGSWFYFDVVAYADMLLEELGLSSHRQKGWFGNLLNPCFADDLKGLVDEYKARHHQ